MNMQLPVPRTTITSICAAREASLAMATRAGGLLTEAYALTNGAAEKAKSATGGFRAEAPHDTKAQAHLFQTDFDAEKSLAAYRKSLDANIWSNLMAITGMSDMMDKTAKDELRQSLVDNVPEATEENITATLQNLFANSELIFQRGLAKAFIKLDKRFKSHDGFRNGSRMIMERLFDDYGSWNGYHGQEDTLRDVERVFSVLDGEKPSFNSLREAINHSRKGYGARQSVTEGTYFRVRGFKNGNAHLWFTRDDLVEKANQLLAGYYGSTLPDAATVNEAPTSTAVATKLQFYGTPPAAAATLLSTLALRAESRVLEPSSGEGALVRALMAKGVKNITAVEVHPQRAAYTGAICANFLTLALPNSFDFVVMNPPFSGTHWMDHVRKAFTHLHPGGTLRAILPASAEVNETAKHIEFRDWAKRVNRGGAWRQWASLPPESFAALGTNIETVILEIKK